MKRIVVKYYMRLLVYLCIRTACKWFREHPEAYIFFGSEYNPNDLYGPRPPRYSDDIRDLYDTINGRKYDIWNWLRLKGLEMPRDSGHTFTVYVAREALRRSTQWHPTSNYAEVRERARRSLQ